MAIHRRDFIKGKMDLDTDTRLLEDGKFRRAENILVINSEGSDVGSIQKSFSNKQMTNLNLGTNVKCLLGLEDEYEKKIYWFTKSNQGCYLIEWDDDNQIATIVLEDTRTVGRVLDLDENHLITGISKIISEDKRKNLLMWTDDNIEPCCINIARAKTYGANNFTKEDIYLIKKPPSTSPGILPINIAGVTNNMEEKFLSFCYRFKYLDGEYSALSTYANYAFNPKDFDLNFYTLDNKGMINAFNAVKIFFNTGERQVTDIQLVFKESWSNSLYLIETFNKVNEGWADNVVKDYTFSNNKIYTQLPTKELFRACDYVPKKAKSLTVINNIPVFGNYVEGMNIADKDGNKIVPDYQVSMTNIPIDQGNDFITTNPNPNQITVSNPSSIPLLSGNKLVFYFNLLIAGSAAYEGSFYYILPQNFNSLADVFASLDFEGFLAIIQSDFQNNYEYNAPDGWVVYTEPTITYTLVGGVSTFTITPVTFIDTTASDTPHIISFSFVNNSYVSITASSNATSCKTNRDYEIGIVYEDDFGRKTTVLTAAYNTIHISQLYSIYKNRLQITINSPAPAGAKRFHVVVKAQPLQYQIIYINRFYNEDFYVWAKLEAENKDKVKVGDILIVKKGPDPLPNPVKVKVLEIKEQIKDFITGNADENGNDIVEEAGLYMKIRPEGFSMDFDDYKINSGEAHGSSSNTPVAYLDLFTDLTGPTELAIPQGSSISLYFDSTFHWDSGWRHNIYDVVHYAQRNYGDIEEWFTENIIGRNLFITNSVNVIRNYGPQLSLVRGSVVNGSFGPIFTANPSGKLYLKVIGLESGGSGGRKGRVDAKIVVRSSSGFYVFETEPKQADNDIFYETAQTFDISDGNHHGNIQDQDTNVFQPCVIDLDFFNCYTMGNGVESYRVRDGFNTNALNIDLRPSAAMIEQYREVRRKASLTHGEAYIESTNSNGLNEFNISTGNYKDLDKQYGSVQKLLTRDNDIVVLRQEKASKVLFKKKILYNDDGSSNIVASDSILGDEITYLGENGIGNAPESVAVNHYQIYYANPRRGIMQRLSIDGVEPIIDGLVDYFRDKFIANPNSKKLGGFDPYHKQYFVTIGDEPDKLFSVECGAIISKFEQAQPFTYTLNLNDLIGDILLNYNISIGNATITAEYDGSIFVVSNVTGTGNIEIPRTDESQKEVIITVTPVSEVVSYDISNVCPIGIPMDLVSIVLGDISDKDKTTTTRFRWATSPFYSDVVLFTDPEITKFLVETGIEGQGKFPERNKIVSIESFKDALNDAELNVDQCNRIGYLITENVYTNADIDTILASATWLSLSDIGNSKVGNFLFSKTTDAEKLYLIWDYVDKKPLLLDDTVEVLTGTGIKINMLGNDTFSGESIAVEIISAPINGSAVLNEDNTITYTHNGSDTAEDIIEYQVTVNGCSASAFIHISIYTEETAPTLFRYRVSKGTPVTFECGDTFDSFSPRTIYVDVQPYSSIDWFLIITQIFTDEAGTIPAPAGWYLDTIMSIGVGFHYLYWNGSVVTESHYCEGGGLG